MKIRTFLNNKISVTEFKGRVYNVPGVPGFVVHKTYDGGDPTVQKWWSVSHFNSGCHVFCGGVTKKETVTGFKSWIEIHFESVENFTSVAHARINEHSLTYIN